MKRIFIAVTTAMFLLSHMTSCEDLNITPTTIITGEAIYNEEGIRAYMAGIYCQLPMEDFKYSTLNRYTPSESYAGYFSRTGQAPLWGYTGEMVGQDTNLNSDNMQNIPRKRML